MTKEEEARGPAATGPTLESSPGGRLDAINSSDRVTLSQLAVDPSMIGSISTKVQVTASAGKPAPGMYFRTNASPEFSILSAALKAPDGSGVYLATDLVRQLVPEEVTFVQLFVYMTRAGGLGVWPISMPRGDGRMTEWTRSALEAAYLAMKEWVRIRANMSIGAYEVHRLMVSIPEPEWPNLTFEQILRIAFRDRIIDSTDHPLVRQLQGLA